MSFDQVRARAASTRRLANDAVKHTNVAVGLVATTHTCDERCTQVTFYVAPADVNNHYLRFDRDAAGGGTTITAANGVPVSSGQPYDVEPGTIVQLICDAAGQTLRALEALTA